MPIEIKNKDGVILETVLAETLTGAKLVGANLRKANLGGDNLFKGHSSFVVEMNELRTILKKSDHNTLVLADECMHRTEAISGTAIIAATLLKLSKNNVKYLFATHLHDLPKLKVIQELKIDELIFCAKDISARQIIQIMGDVKSEEIDFKIAQPDAQFIIGSNSIDNSGEMYVLNISTLNRPSTLRSKRLLDVIFAVIGLSLSPILTFLFNNKKQFLKNRSF